VLFRFQLFPQRISHYVAILILLGELSVIVLLLNDGDLLTYGFLLALILLIQFSIAIRSVLVRGIETSCNCFGSSQKSVTIYSLWRNVIFIICSVVGFIVSLGQYTNYINTFSLELAVLGLISLTFIILTINIEDIAQLFRNWNS
jgi:hypothetical protein